MIYGQYCKEIVLFGPGTIASGATTSARFDTLGFKYAEVVCIGPPASSTTSTTNHRFSVLFVAQGDSTAYTSASTAAAFNGTTNTVTSATASLLIVPNADTSVGNISKFGIDLRNNRGRYLFPVVQGNSSHSTVTVLARLYRADVVPNSDTERGLASSSFG